MTIAAPTSATLFVPVNTAAAEDEPELAMR
jgi:hypothetical protein